MDATVMDSSLLSAVLAFILSSARLSVPLAYGALGGYFSERSGVVNIALDGLLLIGAFSSASVTALTHNPWLGLCCGITAATLLALLHAFFCITLACDQIISGLAIHFLAMGLTPVVCKSIFDMSGATPLLTASDRIPSLFGESPLLFFLFVCAVGSWFFHHHTKLGTYIRFAGECPEALATQGISVYRVRWFGVLMSGVFCGIGGAFLSIDHGSGFSRNMTAGRGFIALAALIIGRWNPIGAILGAFAFGTVEVSQILLQGVSLPGGSTVPIQWIQIIPYIATLFILTGFGLKKNGVSSRPPKMLGQPFELAP